MKKILALLLALIMVVSMVACGKTAPTAPDAEASQPEASQPEASQPEAQQGGTSVDAGGKVTTEYNAPDEVTTDKELPPSRFWSSMHSSPISWAPSTRPLWNTWLRL